jgi:hypothetical protein
MPLKRDFAINREYSHALNPTAGNRSTRLPAHQKKNTKLAIKRIMFLCHTFGKR